MHVREWEDVIRDVVEADVEPDDWKAISGPRTGGLGQDLYLAHPNRGVFQLKTYAKNPFERRGVGARVARSIDDEIEEELPGIDSHRFAVRSAPSDRDEATERAEQVKQTLSAHDDGPADPRVVFEDVMRAVDSPAFGPLQYDPDTRLDELDGLASTFDEAESVLSRELDDLLNDDGVGRGFH